MYYQESCEGGGVERAPPFLSLNCHAGVGGGVALPSLLNDNVGSRLIKFHLENAIHNLLYFEDNRKELDVKS